MHFIFWDELGKKEQMEIQKCFFNKKEGSRGKIGQMASVSMKIGSKIICWKMLIILDPNGDWKKRLFEECLMDDIKSLNKFYLDTFLKYSSWASSILKSLGERKRY